MTRDMGWRFTGEAPRLPYTIGDVVQFEGSRYVVYGISYPRGFDHPPVVSIMREDDLSRTDYYAMGPGLRVVQKAGDS